MTSRHERLFTASTSVEDTGGQSEAPGLWRSTFLRQLRRYLVVGGLAWVVDLSSLVVLTELLDVHYVVSATIAFSAGLVVNYAFSIAWVFDRRVLNSRTTEFGIFGLIGLVGVGLNTLIVWGLTEALLPHYLYAKMASTGAVLWWNFLAKKYILFR